MDLSIFLLISCWHIQLIRFHFWANHKFDTFTYGPPSSYSWQKHHMMWIIQTYNNLINKVMIPWKRIIFHLHPKVVTDKLKGTDLAICNWLSTLYIMWIMTTSVLRFQAPIMVGYGPGQKLMLPVMWPYWLPDLISFYFHQSWEKVQRKEIITLTLAF